MKANVSYGTCSIFIVGTEMKCPFCGTLVKSGEQHSCEVAKPIAAFPYVYAWNRMGRKGQRCRVLSRGKMNSCAVEFEDGHRAVTSRNALRKAC